MFFSWRTIYLLEMSQLEIYSEDLKTNIKDWLVNYSVFHPTANNQEGDSRLSLLLVLLLPPLANEAIKITEAKEIRSGFEKKLHLVIILLQSLSKTEQVFS